MDRLFLCLYLFFLSSGAVLTAAPDTEKAARRQLQNENQTGINI